MIIEEVQAEGKTRNRYIISPNSSLSWSGNKWFFVSMCIVSFGVAGVFAAQGFWIVLPFAGLEMAILGFTLYICAYRARWREVISVFDDRVEIVMGHKRPELSRTFNRHWAQVELVRSSRRGHPSRLAIRSHGRDLEIGTCLSNEEKDALARSLTQALAA